MNMQNVLKSKELSEDRNTNDKNRRQKLQEKGIKQRLHEKFRSRVNKQADDALSKKLDEISS